MRKFACVKQHDVTDCAAAVLATVCLYYKKDISISKLRDLCGTDTKGTTLDGLLYGADMLGFDAKAVRVSEAGFVSKFRLPAIAHIITKEGLTHFVVIHSIRNDRIIYADPAKGIVKTTLIDFYKSFTFTLVLIKPTNLFVPEKKSNKPILSLFLQLLSPQKRLFAAAIVASVILTVLGIVGSFFNKLLIDEILPYSLHNQLTIFCIGFLILAIVQIGVSAIRQHVLLHLSQKIDIPLMLGYYKHVITLPMKFFGTRHVGDILTRFSDATTIKGVVTSIILSLIIDIVLAITSGIILYFMNTTLFIIVVILVIISIILVYIFKRPYKALNIIEMEQNSKLNSLMIESLRGVETIKANANEDENLEQLETRFIATLKTDYKEGVLSNFQSSISGLIGTVGNLVMMWVGATFVMDGKMSLGTLMAFSSLAGFFMDPISRMVGLQISIQEASIAMKRLSEIYENKPESNGNTIPLSLNGNIEIKKITFRYGKRAPILRDINLRFEKNKKYAIVGESGSGKTTLAKIILGLWAPESGEIILNGYSLDELNLHEFRRKIAYVQQNVDLFSGSIIDNIKVGNPTATRNEIIDVCKMVGCDEFINRMPAKYDAYLEEAGLNLSGGEKQRLALARALIKNPNCL
ncbi:MAG: peptidase domain-containing ABC transporter [Clostridiales bacterium]|jgi:ATP-binding cassette subfamily B protein|nr:peptidase domain-containing ABC transporter [Clostridiales bacterium]